MIIYGSNASQEQSMICRDGSQFYGRWSTFSSVAKHCLQYANIKYWENITKQLIPTWNHEILDYLNIYTS